MDDHHEQQEVFGDTLQPRSILSGGTSSSPNKKISEEAQRILEMRERELNSD
jgi:hypothetical protein